jgi:pilus assembly protein CpaB
MNVKTWIPLGLAVVLGLVAAKLTHDAVARKRAPAGDEKLVATVTASRDIEPGQKLTAADLAVGKVSPDALPAGVFNATADVVDRVASTRLVKGQTILSSMLAPIGSAAGVQALIPPGMRAITVQVNEFSGVAGLLTPGCKVDIITVIRNQDADQTVAKTIVQNVEVRAVGRQIAAPSGNAPAAPAGPENASQPPTPAPTNVTLLVSPEQAETVQLACAGGTPPWLVLRNAEDKTPVQVNGISLADLRGWKSRAVSGPVETETTSTTKTPGDAKLIYDPFAERLDASSTSNRTRTVNIIRATKEERVTVDVPTVPASTATTPTAKTTTLVAPTATPVDLTSTSSPDDDDDDLTSTASEDNLTSTASEDDDLTSTSTEDQESEVTDD